MSGDDLEAIEREFAAEGFDAEKYAQDILAKGTAVSDQLNTLAAFATQLDKQLRKQVYRNELRLVCGWFWAIIILIPFGKVAS